MAFFDLSKAFNRVPQQVLFSPGSNPIYLRSQLVSVHGVDSDPVPVISGIPEVLSLGLYFFLSMSMIFASLTFLPIALWSHTLMILLSIGLFHILLTCLFFFFFFFFFQFNSIYLFSIIKNSKTFKKVRICTQQDGGGTTKSKSLKMLYPLYR